VLALGLDQSQHLQFNVVTVCYKL